MRTLFDTCKNIVGSAMIEIGLALKGHKGYVVIPVLKVPVAEKEEGIAEFFGKAGNA